ncbi:aromatic acid exporter family protein [Bacillus sp. WMMC1349]|uniref:aromatic acid exporter family protein n=1 Tax=Bacillus sp. WMMC1349 TaxID=2736254 RepID=UPI001554DD1D|nr:aromatic acid exporter family protein [Bacillus sp. WMMC1349]NPC93220.1 aromatic acid exporter family protein [Bacillus sp. WMMC1349]
MFKIGYRTLKTALGTGLSIYLAQLFGLHNFVSAGIITILCIQVTKKRSLQASWSRFVACCLAILFSYSFFELIGYHPVVISLMLLFFIPTTVFLKVNEGVVTSSVIILHLYMSEGITIPIIWNEFLIIITGIGVALLMNLYMPSVDKQLKQYQQKIEDQFSIMFKEIERYLLTGDQDWTGKEIPETHRLINEAKAIAYRDVQNHFLRHENQYYRYFKMREKQFDIIERVLPKITSISIKIEQGQMIADFIHDLRLHIHPGNTAHKYLKRLVEMREIFEEMELPATREEFEARAALFNFLGEMEQYLVIKSYFKGIKSPV